MQSHRIGFIVRLTIGQFYVIELTRQALARDHRADTILLRPGAVLYSGLNFLACSAGGMEASFFPTQTSLFGVN